MNSYLTLLLVIWGYMTFWFVISVIKKRNDVADTAWGLGFILLAWISFFISSFSVRALLVNGLITIWGIRLAFHIYNRNKNRPEDSRYKELQKTWSHFHIRSYLQIFLLQGVFIFLISLPVIFINLKAPKIIGPIGIAGLILWGIGFYFETKADSQLKKFISDPANKGKLIDRGLWRYSRHPNYFGEVTQWWGIFLFALPLPNSFFTVIGPITITVLILFVSGIPLLEKKYAGRPDWERYKRKTSIFFPLPQKRYENKDGSCQ